MECLLDGIQRYGKPEEVLTDQGRQYFAWRGKSGFQKLLEREGIRHVVSRTHHPETLGKAERLWETIGRELWDRTHPQDLEEARERLGHYLHHYNHFRPHQGLGGMVPADRFFGVESEVRKALEASIDANELRLALGERPRRPVYLVGQVDGEVVSLHGERGRLVVSTGKGAKDLDLNELGTASRKRGVDGDGSEHGDSDGSGDGPPAPAASGAAHDQAGAIPAGPAAGLSDPELVGCGDGGGAADGARALRDDAGILARPRDEGGGGAAAVGAADPRVAALAARPDGHGGGTADPAVRAEGQAEGGRGRPVDEEADRDARGRARDGEAADRDPADDAGQRDPGPRGGTPARGAEGAPRPNPGGEGCSKHQEQGPSQQAGPGTPR